MLKSVTLSTERPNSVWLLFLLAETFVFRLDQARALSGPGNDSQRGKVTLLF